MKKWIETRIFFLENKLHHKYHPEKEKKEKKNLPSKYKFSSLVLNKTYGWELPSSFSFRFLLFNSGGWCLLLAVEDETVQSKLNRNLGIFEV